jgi:hypothetical protein
MKHSGRGPITEVVDEPPRLLGQFLRTAQDARRGGCEQLFVGRSGPEEVGEPNGEFVVGERAFLAVGRWLGKVEEHRRG